MMWLQRVSSLVTLVVLYLIIFLALLRGGRGPFQYYVTRRGVAGGEGWGVLNSVTQQLCFLLNVSSHASKT